MSEKVLMKGNEAIAEAAIRAGCRHYFGYPITPQNEIAAYMSRRMPQVDGVFLQAESEIGAVHMVIGASSVGRRAMTTSSSPGISLKTEGLSYLAGCDLPAVCANIQRGGPGLGTIQPSQADYFQSVKGGGHGDYKMIVFAPSTVQEAYDQTALSFDIADKYRVTCMLLSDGILGQMMEAVDLSTVKEGGNAVAKPWATTGTQGKRDPNLITSLFLYAEQLEAAVEGRYKRYAEIEKNEVRWEEFHTEDAEVVFVSYGASARSARNAVRMARAEGIKAGMLRPITVWPFPNAALKALAPQVKGFISVEMSMGQMVEDVKLAIECSKPVYMCNRTGGVVPAPEAIVAKAKEVVGGAK